MFTSPYPFLHLKFCDRLLVWRERIEGGKKGIWRNRERKREIKQETEREEDWKEKS
jgi:hypothetical protein